MKQRFAFVVALFFLLALHASGLDSGTWQRLDRAFAKSYAACEVCVRKATTAKGGVKVTYYWCEHGNDSGCVESTKHEECRSEAHNKLECKSLYRNGASHPVPGHPGLFHAPDPFRFSLVTEEKRINGILTLISVNHNGAAAPGHQENNFIRILDSRAGGENAHFNEKFPHCKAKRALIREFSRLFSTHCSANNEDFVIYDGFSGPGIHYESSDKDNSFKMSPPFFPGSPLVVLEGVIQAEHETSGKIKKGAYIFNEFEPSKHRFQKGLVGMLLQYQVSPREGEKLRQEIKQIQGDFTQNLLGPVKTAVENGGGKHLFAIVDPYGFKTSPADSIHKLFQLKAKSVSMILNFSTLGMYKAMRKKNEKNKLKVGAWADMKDFLGTDIKTPFEFFHKELLPVLGKHNLNTDPVDPNEAKFTPYDRDVSLAFALWYMKSQLVDKFKHVECGHLVAMQNLKGVTYFLVFCTTESAFMKMWQHASADMHIPAEQWGDVGLGVVDDVKEKDVKLWD